MLEFLEFLESLNAFQPLPFPPPPPCVSLPHTVSALIPVFFSRGAVSFRDCDASTPNPASPHYGVVRSGF